MASLPIRIVGDPVLREKASEVADVDSKFIKLVDQMFVSMYDAPGIGLAAPQIGVKRRFFVYDVDDEPGVLINPVITGMDGEWEFDEGCLSIPGKYFTILRPKVIEVTGYDLDGVEVSFEADDLWARLIQHEMDHLNGVLMLDHLDGEQANEAKRHVRELQLAQMDAPPEPGFGITASPRRR